MIKQTDKINPKVVDLSHHNTPASFDDAYKVGIRGIIHKATQGLSYSDPTYYRRKDNALKAGMLWGAYHFADDTDPRKQWDNFYKFVKPDDKTIMALDYEPNGNHTMNLENARKFLIAAEEALGRKAVLYSGNLIKETLKKPDAFFNAHPLWLAQYATQYELPVGWTKYWIRQFTGDGSGANPHEVAGLGKGLDINTYAGSDDDLRRDWYKAPTTVVASPQMVANVFPQTTVMKPTTNTDSEEYLETHIPEIKIKPEDQVNPPYANTKPVDANTAVTSMFPWFKPWWL